MEKNLLKEKLLTDNFHKKMKVSHNFEKYSGSGFLKILARLIKSPSIYLPYLLLVKLKLFKIKETTAKLFWGMKIKIPINDYDSLALFRFGFAGGTMAELKLTKYIINNLNKDDIFYDIGANYGYFSYLASEICKEVHSFEPNPKLIETLNANSTKKMLVNNFAISNTVGEVDLYMSESSGLSTINKNTVGIHTYKYTDNIKIKTSTLDEYTNNNSKPTFIKIDVEGAEESVVDGALEFLSTSSPIIALEIWGKNNGGDISIKTIEKMGKIGYRPYLIKNDGSIEEVYSDILDLVPENGGDNFIFLKK